MIARSMPEYSLPFAFLVTGCMTAATDRGDIIASTRFYPPSRAYTRTLNTSSLPEKCVMM
jgi:hypothetical protein